MVAAVNATDGPANRPARRLRWVIYLMAIGITPFGWIAFLSYCALALLTDYGDFPRTSSSPVPALEFGLVSANSSPACPAVRGYEEPCGAW